ncbi:acid protease [Lactarius akahatsu]|uniref:Acid protease n=1 Tax=Lactarius akahatsu TaxID=416441 RepID=A0AAD4QFG7_9AGAM|nr:acid protease [Lactarius akahatsu]
MLPSILFALFFFGLLSLAVVPSRRDLLHIPVIRRNKARRGEEADTTHYSAVLSGLRHKYNYDSPGALRRAQTTDIRITNQGADFSYFAQVNVGTPAQSFNLILDTGSSDLWFATTVCASCPSGTPEFDPSKSTSLQTGTDPISLKYGSGSAAGIIARDTITMGPFTVDQQIFVAVTDITSGLIKGALAGIMGLAFQGIASTDALPFWQALVNDNLFPNPEFSFFITRFVDDASAKDEEPGGVLTLGGTNTTLYQGDIDFRSFTSPIKGGSFWLQTVTGVTVNGKSVSLPSGDLAVAAIDTGTTLIGGPTAAVNAVWAAVPGAVALGGNLAGSFAFPCKTDLAISLSFGGPSWPISLADMNLGTVGNGRCLGAIFDITQGTNVTPGEGNPAWIIGDTFLKNVYSVFRASPPAVGFAQLSNAAGGSSG